MLISNIAELQGVEGLVPKDDVARLQVKIAVLQQQLPTLQHTWFVVIAPNVILPLTFIVVLFIYPLLIFFYVRRIRVKWIRRQPEVSLTRMLQYLADPTKGKNRQTANFKFLFAASIVIGTFMYVVLEGMRGITLPTLLPLLFGTGIGFLLQRLNWPNNALLSAVADIVSPLTTGKVEQLDFAADQDIHFV